MSINFVVVVVVVVYLYFIESPQGLQVQMIHAVHLILMDLRSDFRPFAYPLFWCIGYCCSDIGFDTCLHDYCLL